MPRGEVDAVVHTVAPSRGLKEFSPMLTLLNVATVCDYDPCSLYTLSCGPSVEPFREQHRGNDFKIAREMICHTLEKSDFLSDDR